MVLRAGLPKEAKPDTPSQCIRPCMSDDWPYSTWYRVNEKIDGWVPMSYDMSVPTASRLGLQARSSGRHESGIDSSRLRVLRFGHAAEPRRPLEGSPGEIALVDPFDGPRWTFRAEG